MTAVQAAAGQEPDPPAGVLFLAQKIDETHDAIEKNILEQTVRLDEFFGSPRADNTRQTGYTLRWRSSLRVEEGGRIRPGTGASATMVLSQISDRLRVAISGEKESESFAQRLPQDPGNPGFDRTVPAARLVNTELRYSLAQTASVDSFIGAGLRLSIPFEVFVRSRFQYTLRLNEVSLLRASENFFMKNTDRLGETTEFSIERLFGRDTIVRWASTATASEQIAGLEWGSELSWIRQLSPRRGITLTGGLYGNTNSSAAVDDYRILARYRQNFHRSWLYYELQSEVSWPRKLDGRYDAVFAVTLCLEVVFQGKTGAHDGQAKGKK